MSHYKNWIDRIKPNPAAALRMFCFPFAGGFPTLFRKWHEGLPKFVEVCPMQLPGRAQRFEEKSLDNWPELLETLENELKPYLDRPFCFFGHSMGALLSFELARRIGARGLKLLFVSGCRAPQTLKPPERPLHRLDDPELILELKRLNGTPPEVLNHPEMMNLILPPLRADLKLIETYPYGEGPALDCDITAFGGLEDREVPRMDLEKWAEQTKGKFAVHFLSGDHFYLNSERERLLKIISEDLEQSHLPIII